MGFLAGPVVNAVQRVVDQAPMGSDAKLRLQHYSLLLFLGLPTMFVFGVILILQGDRKGAVMVLTTVFALAVGWVLLGRGVKPALVYRTNTVAFCVLLLYLAAVGGEGGSKVLWTYTFPLISFFLMGKREGAVWVGIVFGFSALLVLGLAPGLETYAYPAGFQSRYLVTMATVVAIAAGFEHFRENYRRGMEEERVKLQAALDDVKALSGLLPICAHCKKIRDDDGYWNKLESFIQDHTDARLSHGICPECVAEHYADLGLDPPPET